VTLVKCGTNVFGGYTDQSWKVTGPYIVTAIHTIQLDGYCKTLECNYNFETFSDDKYQSGMARNARFSYIKRHFKREVESKHLCSYYIIKQRSDHEIFYTLSPSYKKLPCAVKVETHFVAIHFLQLLTCNYIMKPIYFS
jgi:hypothetical protein